jgi:hypothetical protein
MLMALGAASSLWDTLQSLAMSNTSSTQSASTSQTASGPFALTGPLTGSAAPSTSSAPPSGTSGSNQISPQTMSALLDAQSQSGSTTTASLSPSQALQDLFSDIDANGDGEISQQEFENALGAGGTNVAAADQVFNQIDTNGDGEISLNELQSALQGAGGHHGGHHHHMHAAGSTDSGDGSNSGSTDPDNTDPLLQAVAASTGTTNGSSTGTSSTSSVTPADPSQVTPISLSASTYNMIEKMLQGGGQTFASAPLSFSV